MIIGLDVGGTHTDAVLIGTQGVVKQAKVVTDASDLFQTVLSGLEKVTRGIDADAVERVVLSTTLTTNAVIQKKLPSVGMIVTGGPGLDPELFRTNRHYHRVTGALDHRGWELEAVDPDQIRQVALKLKRAGIQLVGVVGKFSVRNPDHENAIGEILRPHFDKVFLGHSISGNLNFPRRIATTYLNTAVYPIHKEFFEAVKKSLEKKGLRIPIHVLKADAGTMNFESSIAFPDQTIFSGPAASAMGASMFAPADEACLVMDIGGTTTDLAILIEQVPVLEPLGIRCGTLKTLIRSLKTESIGIGGDSRVRVVGGQLKIGPERRGAAMAYGGPSPTPTDALCVLGLIKSDRYRESAAGMEDIARRLGLDVAMAAQCVFDQTCRRILAAARDMIDRVNRKPVYTIHELQEGYQVNPRKILVLGGPAPYFAPRLQTLSDYEVSVVPRWNVANAVGTAMARTTCEVILFADTEKGIVSAPEENFSQTVARDFSREEARQIAYRLLKHKALERGADPADLEMETVEDLQFNMVRGFYTTGRNIRLRVQVRPGLIKGYASAVMTDAGAATSGSAKG